MFYVLNPIAVVEGKLASYVVGEFESIADAIALASTNPAYLIQQKQSVDPAERKASFKELCNDLRIAQS